MLGLIMYAAQEIVVKQNDHKLECPKTHERKDTVDTVKVPSKKRKYSVAFNK